MDLPPPLGKGNGRRLTGTLHRRGVLSSESGETTWNQGETSIGEQKCGMHSFDYFADDDEESAYQLWEIVRQNVEQLPLLASIWSVDPVALEDEAMRTKPGWVGRMPLGRSEKS